MHIQAAAPGEGLEILVQVSDALVEKEFTVYMC